MASLKTTFCGIELTNPLVLASGIMGVSASTMGFVAERGAGAVTTKSCSLEPRKGHPPPVVAVMEGGIGLLNAVGLSNPGADAMADEIRAFRKRFPIPIFASVFGRDADEYGEVTACLVAATPDLIEVNVSCPNVAAEFGEPFAANPEATAAVLRRVKDECRGIPVAVKLSFGCPSLARMARVCEDAGADAITAINTVGPGLLIDTRMRRPILSNVVGGLSGPAILPLAVKAVWEIHDAVRIPILGTGGVSCADDAIQMILAGASLVGVGTAFWQRGEGIFGEIAQGLSRFMEEEGLSSLSELRGAAHA